MDGGIDGTAHKCYVTFNRWNDERNVNVNRNDNDWNDNWSFAGVPKLSSFLLLRGGVLLPQLSLPTAEHLADLVEWGRQSSVLLSVERLAFPEDKQ